MRAEHLTDYRAVILTPEPADRPEVIEDAIDDELAKTRDPADPKSKPRTTLVLLDFSELEDGEFPLWMKAAGPEIPGANLRIVVSPKRLRVAQALGLTFYHDWFDSLQAALKAGA